MIHEVLSVALLVGDVSDPASTVTPANNDTVVQALIGGAVAIVLALIANYFGTRRERHPKDSRAVRDAVLDAAHSENDRRDAETKAAQLEARVEVYERALTLRGYAPWKFKTGEEPDSHVRIVRPAR